MNKLYILGHLQAKSLEYRRYDDFRAPDFCVVNCEKTGRTRPIPDANEEWVIQATLSVTFWANTAQYQQARVIAERTLAHRLYADVLGDLAELHMQISNGDKRACTEIVFRIEGKIRM